MTLAKLSIHEAAAGLAEGRFSAEELVTSYLVRAKRENPKLNAFLSFLDEAEITAQARQSDSRRQEGTVLGPLDGIPLAIKDNISMEGTRTTAGSKILADYLSPYDATVVGMLRQAGAVIVGKTNLDEFAMGSSTEYSAFGPTKNPLDPTRVPGGSSGGSAAAVAADLVCAALGSDTGGSIRQPAAFCGIVGFKPSYGAVSRYGLIAMASSLDQIGPLTKTVADAKLLFEAIAGHDPDDATSLPEPLARWPIEMKKVRIGIPHEFFGEGLEAVVADRVRAALRKLEKLGATLSETRLPHLPYALAVYHIIVPAEVSANLARYDGVRYGLRATSEELFDLYTKTRAAGFGDEVKRRIILGTFALSAGYFDAFYLKAKKVQAIIKQEFDRAFEMFDFLAGPVTPTLPFKLGERLDDPLKMYLADIFTIPANLAGLPAISVPCGNHDGLSVGLQLIGPERHDWQLLELASAFEGM